MCFVAMYFAVTPAPWIAVAPTPTATCADTRRDRQAARGAPFLAAADVEVPADVDGVSSTAAPTAPVQSGHRPSGLFRDDRSVVAVLVQR